MTARKRKRGLPRNRVASERAPIAPATESEEFVALCHRAERNAAQRDGTLNALAELFEILRKQGGYMTPQDQARLRAAHALLAEHGRVAP